MMKFTFPSCGDMISVWICYSGHTGLVSVAIGAWAWVVTTAVFVFMTDFLGDEGGHVSNGRALHLEYRDDAAQKTGEI